MHLKRTQTSPASLLFSCKVFHARLHQSPLASGSIFFGDTLFLASNVKRMHTGVLFKAFPCSIFLEKENANY